MDDAKPYIEIIAIDSEDNARHTGMAQEFDTMAQAKANWVNYRKHEDEAGRFMIDLHDVNGDLVDSYIVNDDGFRAITGQEPMSGEAYVAYDEEMWAEIRTDYEAAKDDTEP